MVIRGIRGATTVENDRPDEIIAGTQKLLDAIVQSNPGLRVEDIASALFTTTDDLVSIHPAVAARQMGWRHVPMMCASEIPVPGSLPHCIRVLIHWNTEYSQEDIRHVYLCDAVRLRPDLS